MAGESTRQGNLETACWGLRPTTGHNGCLMMMIIIIIIIYLVTILCFSAYSTSGSAQATSLPVPSVGISSEYNISTGDH